MVKKKMQQKIINILAIILVPIQIVLVSYLLGTSLLSPSMVRKLSKDPNNIKNGGCLTYAGLWRHSTPMFSLNKQGARRLDQLTIPEFPFQKKWDAYDRDFYVSFKEKHNDKCFKVKYIKHKFMWSNNDYIYDIE